MPGDIDYINLGRMILPLELNYCQCMLELEEYYEVIEHTTDLLEKHKGKFLVGLLNSVDLILIFRESKPLTDWNTSLIQIFQLTEDTIFT